MQSLFYEGDEVLTPRGIGTVTTIHRNRSGRNVYTVKLDPKFTAASFEEWELERVEN